MKTKWKIKADWVKSDPDTLSGEPRIWSTRITAQLIQECLDSGMSPQEISKDYPGFPVDALAKVWEPEPPTLADFGKSLTCLGIGWVGMTWTLGIIVGWWGI